MNGPTVKELEVSIEDAKACIARADALERLMENKDFQLIVVDGFLGLLFICP